MTANMGKLGTAVSRGVPTGFASVSTPNLAAQYKQTAPVPASGETFANIPAVCAFMRWADMILMRGQLDSSQITKDKYNQAIGNPASNPTPNPRIWFTTHYSIQMQLNLLKESQAGIQARLERLRTQPGKRPHIPSTGPHTTTNRGNGEGCLCSTGSPTGSSIATSFSRLQGNARSMTWVMVQLSKRMGVVDKYFGTYNNYTDAQWDQICGRTWPRLHTTSGLPAIPLSR